MLLYHLDGIRINDSWFCRENDTYHSYFLEYDWSSPQEFGASRQRCGHMTSKDLIHWNYEGVVLKPEEGTWNDRGIATGSVVKYGNMWYMLFSGNSFEKGKNGIGLAVSQDLMTWEKIGNGAVISTDQLYPFQMGEEKVLCRPLADPYIYPEPIDGYYYIFVNSRAEEYPVNRRGATAIFRTRDFVNFEPHKIARLHNCDRMETVQVWKHDEVYYMYAGEAMITTRPDDHTKHISQSFENILLTANSVDGPYIGRQVLHFPETPEKGYFYIAKVMQDPEGRDVMMVNDIPEGLYGPYTVIYNEDRTISLKNI